MKKDKKMVDASTANMIWAKNNNIALMANATQRLIYQNSLIPNTEKII